MIKDRLIEISNNFEKLSEIGSETIHSTELMVKILTNSGTVFCEMEGPQQRTTFSR